jgi:glycosyltransferase involved in cell wall biosynthesis
VPKPKILRITTISLSLEKLLTGQIKYMEAMGFDMHTASHGFFNHPNHNEIFSFNRKLRPIQDLKALFELMRIIRTLKPDIVHSHTPKAGLLGMLASKLCGVKIRMHTVGGLPLMEKNKIFRNTLKLIELFTYSCATHVYCNSFGLKDYIARKLYYSKKLKVVGNGTTNGINLEIFNPNSVSKDVISWIKQEFLITDQTVFIFIGRIVADKGIVELINSFEKVNKAHPRTKLILVGHFEEDLDPLPRETHQKIKLNEDIISVGYQQDVRPYLAVSDILVFPSYREGFPNVPLQAGAMGKAMILSDINGCNEIVKDWINGLLVEPKNESELVDKMTILFEDKNLREELAQKVQNDIRANFEQSVVWDALLNEYKTALEEV